MHFRYFDDLMGSSPEASPKFLFEKEREHSEKITNQIILKNVWKIYIKFAQRFKIISKNF